MILQTMKLTSKLLPVSPYATRSTRDQLWIRICDHFSGLLSLVSKGISLSTGVPEGRVHCSLVVEPPVNFL